MMSEKAVREKLSCWQGHLDVAETEPLKDFCRLVIRVLQDVLEE